MLVAKKAYKIYIETASAKHCTHCYFLKNVPRRIIGYNAIILFVCQDKCKGAKEHTSILNSFDINECRDLPSLLYVQMYVGFSSSDSKMQ